MAEFSNNKTRAVAIELKEKFITHFMKVNAMYAEIGAWVLHCSPDALPTPYDVKVQLMQYADLSVEGLQLTEWGAQLLEAEIGDTLSVLVPCTTSGGSTTGLFDGSMPLDGSATFDGQPSISEPGTEDPIETALPSIPIPDGTKVNVFDFYAPIAAGDTVLREFTEETILGIWLEWYSPDDTFDFAWDLTVDGESILLDDRKAYTGLVPEDGKVRTSEDWNYWLLSPHIPAGSHVEVSIVSSSGLIQQFRVVLGYQ